MKAENIRNGAELRLTKEALDRYGLTDPVYKVDHLQYSAGYKTPFVAVKSHRPENGLLFFKPSDFAGVAA